MSSNAGSTAVRPMRGAHDAPNPDSPLLDSLHEWFENCLPKLSRKSDTTAASRYASRCGPPCSRDLNNAYRRRIYERIRESTAEHEAQLRALLGTSLQGDEQAAYLLTPALVGTDLAKRQFPDVFDLEDKEEVPLVALESHRPGVYRRGPLVLFAHPFFRRSLSRLNNLNDELLSELEALAQTEGVTVKIRLDPDAVGLADQVHEPIEMQYWRGPLFNDNLSSIPPGVTEHEADVRQRFFSLVCRTEFWWQSRRNDALNRQEHIFEAEELREHYSFGSSELLYGYRCVHSIIDESQDRIEHLDGAIQEYTDDALILRLDQDIAHAVRHTQYTKYWRADGALRLTSWKTLVYHHFRDNTLVGEYLGMPSAASEAPATQGQPRLHLRRRQFGELYRIPVQATAYESH